MRPHAHALTCPTFTDEQFVATQWDSSADKAWFANALCRLIVADFPEHLWTKRLYRRLSMTFGHIAHYDSGGFWAEFFADSDGKVEFLRQILDHPCYGDPTYTYSDVERAIQARLRSCDTIAMHQARSAYEKERSERALLAALRMKYDRSTPTRTIELPVVGLPDARRPTARMTGAARRRPTATPDQPTLL